MLNYFSGKSTDINSAIKRGKRLKCLQLSCPNYDLNSFSQDFLSFVNLEKLYIHVNVEYPYNLPQEIGELTKLKKLHILNHPFTEFPDWLFKLVNLENLMLRGNDIEKMPKRIIELSNLKHLRIENTNLKRIPKSLLSLTKLKTLSVVDNFKLENVDENNLPPNLKWLALMPSSIPEEQVNQIIKKRPQLKINKRFFN